MNTLNRISASLVLLPLAILTTTAVADDDYQKAAAARDLIDKSGNTWQVALKHVIEQNLGIIFEYDLDEDDGHYFHEFKLINLDSKKKLEVTINIETGEQEIESSSYKAWWSKSNDEVDAAKLILEKGFGLTEAIKIAPLGEQALLMEVEFEQSNGVNYFEIESIDMAGKLEWRVDIDNRNLIPTFKR